MKIGNITLENNVFLAPMAGITDLSFRLLAKEMGAALTYTEMVSAKGLLYDSKNTKALLFVNDIEKPVAVQIFGSDAFIMAEMAAKLEQFDIIDVNMGCPAAKIVRNNEGSALMKNPALVFKIINEMTKRQPKPVTVKIRKGFSKSAVNAVEVAKAAEAGGASGITVHGRTTDMQYSGQSDLGIIRAVKEAVCIPVIGNGDIHCPHSAKKMLDETGCDGIMIGRATYGNPWLLREVIHYLETGQLLPKPTKEEKIALALRHARLLIAHKGVFTGTREMRKFIAWYTKGMENSAHMRVRIFKADSMEEMEAILREI